MFQHIVVEADLGTRTIEQFKSSQTEFTKYAMENVSGNSLLSLIFLFLFTKSHFWTSQIESSVSVSGSYMGYSASLQVDVKKFKESMSEKTKFGENKQVLTSGGDDLPEPIGIKLEPIDVALKSVFYTSLDSFSIVSAGYCFTSSLLDSKRANVQKALVEYPKKKGAIKPIGMNKFLSKY